jgi:hypothetical protein
MATLPVIQQKIFATKKRLSEPTFSDQMLWCLGLCCLLAVITFSGRLLTRSGEWGIITLDLPVASEPFADEMLNGFKESPATSINPHTVVLAVTPSELIFGDVLSFTSQKNDVRNKYVLAHSDGSPQVNDAIKQITSWQEDRRRRQSIRPDGILVVLPDPGVPIAVVAVVVDKIKKTGSFSHVVLGGGIL